MHYRPFGNTELSVSEIGFGCARIGGVFSASSRSATLRLLHRALDEGITFFDTADIYAQGESERLLGEAFRGRRDRVVIATKFGFKLPTQKRLIARIKPMLRPLVNRLGLKSRQIHAGLRGTVSEQDFSPAYIVQAAEASLRRLKSDYLDVYQLHSPPPDVLQRGDFVDALERLRQQGKIRCWGIACEQPVDVLRSLQYTSIGSVQVSLSVLEQAALDNAIPRASEHGLAIIARQVFASGLLTRPIEAIRHEHLDADAATAQRKHQQLEAFAAIAQRCGRERAELALKFNQACRGLSVVLLGLSRDEQLDAGLRGLRAPDLTREEYQLLLNAGELQRNR